MISETTNFNRKGKITDKLYLNDNTALYIIETPKNHIKQAAKYIGALGISSGLIFAVSQYI